MRKKSFLAIGIAVAAVLAGAGWTRNKLAADRQGDWVRVTRGDLVTGIDVTGTLAAVDSGSFVDVGGYRQPRRVKNQEGERQVQPHT